VGLTSTAMFELPGSGTVATMLPAMDGAAVETRNAVMRTTFERVWVMLPHMAHPPFGRKGVRLEIDPSRRIRSG